MIVTHRQHGHMQVNANLHHKPLAINSLIHKSYGLYIIIGRYGERERERPNDPDNDSDDGKEEGEEGEGETQEKAQRPAFTIVTAAHGFCFLVLLLPPCLYILCLSTTLVFRKRKAKLYNLGVGT